MILKSCLRSSQLYPCQNSLSQKHSYFLANKSNVGFTINRFDILTVTQSSRPQFFHQHNFYFRAFTFYLFHIVADLLGCFLAHKHHRFYDIYLYYTTKIPQVNSKILSNGKFKGLIENDRTYTIDDCFCFYHNTKTSAVLKLRRFYQHIYTFAQTLTVKSSHWFRLRYDPCAFR